MPILYTVNVKCRIYGIVHDSMHGFLFNPMGCIVLLYKNSGKHPLAVNTSTVQGVHMEQLHYGFQMEAKLAVERFASLQMMTQQYLQENCTTENLVTCILDVRHVKSFSTHSPLKEVIPATSVGKVFSLLKTRKITTFLQHTLTKRIVCTLCRESEELQEKVKAYEEEFKQYTQVRVVDICNEDFDELCGTDSTDRVDLLIKTDETFNESTQLVKILDLQEAVSHAFHCEKYLLHLKRIGTKDHTVCYTIFSQITKSVFPLTNEEWVYLTQHGVAELKCLDFHYTAQKNGTNILY